MPVIADLHIHSRFSRATSSRLNPAYLERWAAIKGIRLLGTGDCTHPQWLSELREQLDGAEPGLFVLKDDVRAAFDSGPARTEELPRPGPAGGAGIAPNGAFAAPRFVLSGEISTIYKRDGKTRKVHHLILLPDFRAAAAFQTALERVGNIASDGRPILGLDSRTLFSMLLEASDRSVLIPAHIWTPWFSVLGAKSGFDSVEECYGDLAAFIPAVETGLSSDPPMNWALPSLDSFSIISNSDAHSPDKLGREATVFDMELSYAGLYGALFAHKRPGHESRGGVTATVEFFPEEGKYHYDGHRKCGVCVGPAEAAAMVRGAGGAAAGEIICPVCGKPLTRGVMGRVLELAGHIPGSSPAVDTEAEHSNRRPFYSLIPLREVLGELLKTGPGSKKVDAVYSVLIEKAGSELSILMDIDIGTIAGIKAPGLSGEQLAEAVERMRQGRVSISPGYDGEYGVVKIFAAGEQRFSGAETGVLFEDIPVVAHDSQERRERRVPITAAAHPPDAETFRPARLQAVSSGPAFFRFDPAQEAITADDSRRAIVIAGPGTGKTAVLAAKIARIIKQGAAADSVLALSFTVKAAAELRERIETLTAGLGDSGGTVYAATFHSFCCTLLREEAASAGISPDFAILDNWRREDLLRDLCAAAGGTKTAAFKRLGSYIEERKRLLLLPGEERPDIVPEIINLPEILPLIPKSLPELESLYRKYRTRLREAALLDYEDLIAGTVRLFYGEGAILEKYRRRFRSIFVDEYQDINFGQYVLLRLLAGEGDEAPSLWVIGDPNQAIYGFRGSDRRFIDRFPLDFPGSRRFELARSFRCAAPIISAAGQLTGSALEGISRPVDLYRYQYPSGKSEAEGIARAISRLIGGASFFAKDSDDSGWTGGGPGSGGTNHYSSPYAETASPADCAVLLRAAALAPPVVEALTSHGIPFELTGEQPWWEAEPYKSFLARVRESAAPEAAFQKEQNSPVLKRLFELAGFFGDVHSLLDALACSEPSGLPGIKHEGVSIMTMHASKGLEFDHVFVTALEEGLMPFTLYDRKVSPERIAEERRLLYVAMTRARAGLHLSWARSRIFKGRKMSGTPSRFLEELEKIIPLVMVTESPKKEKQLPLFL
ncbi:MAG: UvrD-helicase domain-containing protein [Treponema sp.]|nr:UvrD-helicase domain-containing protein [Treponema sp.]